MVVVVDVVGGDVVLVVDVVVVVPHVPSAPHPPGAPTAGAGAVVVVGVEGAGARVVTGDGRGDDGGVEGTGAVVVDDDPAALVAGPAVPAARGSSAACDPG